MTPSFGCCLKRQNAEWLCEPGTSNRPRRSEQGTGHGTRSCESPHTTPARIFVAGFVRIRTCPRDSEVSRLRLRTHSLLFYCGKAFTASADGTPIRSFRQNLKEFLRSAHPGFRIDPGGRKVAARRSNPAAKPAPEPAFQRRQKPFFCILPAFQRYFGQLTARSTRWEVGPSTTCGPGDPLCFVVPG